MTQKIYMIVASLMLIGSTLCVMAKESTNKYLISSDEESISDSITVSGRFRNITEGMPRTAVIIE